MVGSEASNSKHSKTGVLKLLGLQVILCLGIIGPNLKVVNGRLAASQEGLAIELLLVFPCFEDSADNEELGPPLGISLHDGIDGVSGVWVWVKEMAKEMVKVRCIWEAQVP